MPATDPNRQAALDAAARQQGYRNYEEYRLFQEQLARKHVGNIEGKANTPQPTATPAPQPNNHLNGGVAGVMDYIRRAMGGR